MNIPEFRNYTIHHVDSFARGPLQGNQTVCILGAETLSDDQMQSLGSELTKSEISCALPSKIADIRLRYFSPTHEVPYCGHATIGALCAFAHDGLYGCKPGEVKELFIETGKGVLKTVVDLTSPEDPVYILDAPKIDMAVSDYSYEQVADGLGIPLDFIDCKKPLLVEKTTNYLYFAVPNLDTLKKIKLDQQKALEFTHKGNHIIVCALTNETFDSGHHVHARGFAPLVGIPEDPFTGSMQGGLGAYVISQGMVDLNAEWFVVEQGHIMGKPGEVKLEILQRSPLHIRLHAKAHHFFRAIMALPNKKKD